MGPCLHRKAQLALHWFCVVRFEITLFSLSCIEAQGLPKTGSPGNLKYHWQLRAKEVLKMVLVQVFRWAIVKQGIWVIAVKGPKHHLIISSDVPPGEYQSYLGMVIKASYVNVNRSHIPAPHSAPKRFWERQEQLVPAAFLPWPAPQIWAATWAMGKKEMPVPCHVHRVRSVFPRYAGSTARRQAIILFMGWRSGQVTMEDLNFHLPLDMEKLIATDLKCHIRCER